jgi:hypothetical protein
VSAFQIIALFVIGPTIVWSAGSVVPETSPHIYCPRLM